MLRHDKQEKQHILSYYEINEREVRKSVGYVSLGPFAESKTDDESGFYIELCTAVCAALEMEKPKELIVNPRNLFDILQDVKIYFDEFSAVGHKYPNFFHRIRAAVDAGSVGRWGNKIVLADRTDPSDYMDPRSSPFNIAGEVFLKDFSPEEAYTLLCVGLQKNQVKVPTREVGDVIYNVLSGHPYLTQTMGQELTAFAKQESAREITVNMVEQGKNKIIAGNDVNLKTLINYWHRKLEAGDKELLKGVMRGERIHFYVYDSPTMRLYSLGFIKPEKQDFDGIKRTYFDGVCEIRNELYREILARTIPKQR